MNQLRPLAVLCRGGLARTCIGVMLARLHGTSRILVPEEAFFDKKIVTPPRNGFLHTVH